MSKFGDSIKHYFSSTQSLLYSYLISLPLLLLYEALLYLSQPDAHHVVRISVDVWIKTLFHYVGQDALSITLIFVALLGVFIIYRERNRLSSLRLSYFFTMLIEASFYAFLLALLITFTVNSLLQMVQTAPVEQLSMLQKMALSLGAGLYEELFFRVILVSALLFIFRKLLSNQIIAYALAMLLAAAIFSFAHYIGELGDPFTLGSFLFRLLFGLALNAIYIWRGFGMAAWTHAIYDLMVIVY
ncbi:MAG TPA: CPBP family glutamic-type intramembrane protease [Balneolaceae bacterium]|nr:CPBP family glutamic-type intramembrane protease [Balneolaceae bacterium]